MWGFRDPKSPSLDKGILKVNENFETSEKRKAIGVISIRVGDLLISGGDVFTEYISHGTKEKSR